MRRNGYIVSGTAEEIRRMLDNGGDMTNWDAVRAMPQSEVERLADEEDGPMPEGWEKSIIEGPILRKQPVHIRLDADILDWFRTRGPGYQTRINAVLRAYVQAREKGQP
jgi:uncharacterized protein (DUF4415 family)